MSNAPSLQAFVRTLEEEIENSKEQGSEFSVVVLSTQSGIAPPERSKLLNWAEFVLLNHAPDSAVVASDREAYRCLMLLPKHDSGQAEAFASYYGEQLNRLPVFGVAPGGGWRWDFATYPGHSDGIRELHDDLAGYQA
jgi:hypothetical protein